MITKQRLEELNNYFNSKTRTGNNKYKRYKDIFGEYGYYRLRKIYTGMKQRCYNKNCKTYNRYGKRGVTICDDWLNNPSCFYDWCIENGYDNNLTIDRIDNNKGYSPDNCRWVDYYIQSKNRKSVKKFKIDGEELTLTDISKKYNIPETTIFNRFYRDKDKVEDIISQGTQRKTNKNAIKYKLNGSYYTIIELAKINSINPITLYQRLRRGDDIEIAILTKENYDEARRLCVKLFKGESV